MISATDLSRLIAAATNAANTKQIAATMKQALGYMAEGSPPLRGGAMGRNPTRGRARESCAHPSPASDAPDLAAEG